MNSSKYAGEFEIVLEKKNENTVISEKKFDGLIKVSPTIHLDSEKISTYFIVGLGGGYVEGEKYKYSINLKEDSRSIITTQSSTKVYKCVNGKKTEQETLINLEKNSILEYITDSVILYKNAIYKQVNNIYMDESATLIYSDGITSGWSKEGNPFQYSNAQLKTNVYVNNKMVLLDNLLVNPREDDVTKLGFFEGYQNFGTLLVINKNINVEIIEELRNDIKNLNLPICFGISELEVKGFVLRVLGNLTQNIESAIKLCHNYIRKKFLNSRELSIRKY
ncbi:MULTISPECIES: urease accessory protein UreD [Clostridium]|uniref:urease accessory protein UreD n=1 Tax=Clostridium TaxID=1485 RepID=UPI00189A5688|nr:MULTISPECIES: urease accessory protein UreD [Clostridium]MDI9218438.1 urease accessory protein UreD [Clostridium tertium]